MVCQGLDVMGSTLNYADIMVYPTTCYYNFYSVIMFGLFIIITLILFYREREIQAQPDLISSAAVSSTAIMILMVIGSLIQSTNGIAMIQQDILLQGIALWIVISAIWFFKK